MNAPSKSDAAALVEHFGSRVFLVLSYFFFVVQFKKDKELLAEVAEGSFPDIRGFRIATIQKAWLNTTLLPIRDLDDFFNPRDSKSRNDDLKASDLGYKEGLRFLTKTERDRIYTVVMHSTVSAVKMPFPESSFFKLGKNKLPIRQSCQSLGGGGF